jgi:nicotinamidase/pyrazinamidase
MFKVWPDLSGQTNMRHRLFKISTHFCVLTTVMDAICHDFKAVLLEDCSAAPSNEVHQQTLNGYRRNPLYPLLKVATSAELLEGLNEE